MPIIGITLDASREYQSAYDSAKGSPEATTFEVGTLDSRIFGMLRDKAMVIASDPGDPNAEAETILKGNEVAFLFVQYGLRGWSNFKDESGKDIPFRTVKQRHGNQVYDIADPNLVKLIPGVVITELAGEIRKANDLEVARRKKLKRLVYALLLMPEWDCKTCTSRQKELRGCEAEPAHPLELDGELLERCPRRPLLDKPALLGKTFWLYRNFDRGILPEEGSLLSQPNKLMRMFAVLDDAKNAAQSEQSKRDQHKAAQQQRMQTMLGGR
jgi:hypothetical protein